MDDVLRQKVCQRAHNRCEYCRIPQSAYDFTFPIDHVIAGIDNATGLIKRLFHPRRDLWHQHFQWNGPVIEGLTEIGRATVVVLAFNNPSRVAARAILIDEGKIQP